MAKVSQITSQKPTNQKGFVAIIAIVIVVILTILGIMTALSLVVSKPSKFVTLETFNPKRASKEVNLLYDQQKQLNLHPTESSITDKVCKGGNWDPGQLLFLSVGERTCNYNLNISYSEPGLIPEYLKKFDTLMHQHDWLDKPTHTDESSQLALNLRVYNETSKKSYINLNYYKISENHVVCALLEYRNDGYWVWFETDDNKTAGGCRSALEFDGVIPPRTKNK